MRLCLGKKEPRGICELACIDFPPLEIPLNPPLLKGETAGVSSGKYRVRYCMPDLTVYGPTEPCMSKLKVLSWCFAGWSKEIVLILGAARPWGSLDRFPLWQRGTEGDF